MLYDVILEAVNPAFRNPTIAALVTLARRRETQAGTLIIGSCGYGLNEAMHLIARTPCPILEGVTQEEAEEAKRHLEAGFFPPDKDWKRPTAGMPCCTVIVRQSADATAG
jgi:hypothetical protein